MASNRVAVDSKLIKSLLALRGETIASMARRWGIRPQGIYVDLAAGLTPHALARMAGYLGVDPGALLADGGRR